MSQMPHRQLGVFLYKRLMTPEIMERDWLSLRFWLRRCVLPACVILVLVLFVMRAASADIQDLNQSALIAGFFTLYFILIRGGHILMIRSLHFDLMRRHESLYREKLAARCQEKMSRRNIGFMLARIKREIINQVKR